MAAWRGSLSERVWALLNNEHWVWPSFGVNHTVKLTLQGQDMTMRTVRRAVAGVGEGIRYGYGRA